MPRCLSMFALAVCAWLCAGDDARAETRVRVIETHPSGSEATLARNQNFYLRLAYETDAPVQIWARPYFRGKPANAGSHPSRSYSGRGEALGWFFLMQPGDRVDEIRITAGDGGTNSTPVVATYPVHVVGGSRAANATAEPSWVATLRARDEAARNEAIAAHAAQPVSAGDMALFGGFMLVALALGLSGIAAPVWALWRWRGGWRLAAMVPAVLMGFVVLRIVAGTAIDPTSHNLWPFEIVIAGLFSAGIVLALVVARKIAGRGLRD